MCNIRKGLQSFTSCIELSCIVQCIVQFSCNMYIICSNILLYSHCDGKVEFILPTPLYGNIAPVKSSLLY